MIKDTIVAISITAVIIAIQVGIFNSVEYYRCRGSDYMCLPQATKEEVMKRLMGSEYAGDTFGTLGALLLVSLVIGGYYYDGMFMFLQSNSETDHDA
jgi:hypothetical protein